MKRQNFLAPLCVSATLFAHLPLAQGAVIESQFGGFARSDGSFSPAVVQIVDATSFPSVDHHGLVEVSLASLSGPVGSAVLTLGNGVIANSLPLPNNFDIFGYAGDGALTFADFGAGTFDSQVSWDGSPILNIDVTSLVNNLLSGGEQWLGVNIRMSSTVSGAGFARFNSQSTAGTPKPFLTVVPEPTTFLLLGLGLAGLGSARRRI